LRHRVVVQTRPLPGIGMMLALAGLDISRTRRSV
jgi:hypothetical protein